MLSVGSPLAYEVLEMNPKPQPLRKSFLNTSIQPVPSVSASPTPAPLPVTPRLRHGPLSALSRYRPAVIHSSPLTAVYSESSLSSLWFRWAVSPGPCTVEKAWSGLGSYHLDVRVGVVVAKSSQGEKEGPHGRLRMPPAADEQTHFDASFIGSPPQTVVDGRPEPEVPQSRGSGGRGIFFF